jgi:4-carboxymuconolactone decarboxylase
MIHSACNDGDRGKKMSSEKFEEGLKIRKEVLGEKYVENALHNVDDFNRPMQELVTEYCWGTIWSRDGLPKKTRSLLNLAMLTALNRPHEVKAHVRGALNNGCSRDEIMETFLQAAVYCGVPAGIDSFRTAKSVFAEIDEAEDNN